MEVQQPVQYPVQNDPYKFIMEPPKPPRAAKFSFRNIGGNSFMVKLVLLIGGAVILMIISAIVINIFFSNKTNIEDVVGIVQTENEIARVAAQGTKAVTVPVQNAAVTTQLTLTTQQQAWTAFLAKQGRKISPKELVLKKDANTDKQLTQARATSTYDLTLTQLLRTQLEAYKGLLKNAYDNASNKQEKVLLESHYKQTNLLLEQLPT